MEEENIAIERKHLDIIPTYVDEEHYREIENIRECRDNEDFYGHSKHPNCNNGLYQQKETLDVEWSNLWKCLMKVSRWDFKGMVKNFNIKGQLIESIHEGKENEKQTKAWDP